MMNFGTFLVKGGQNSSNLEKHITTRFEPITIQGDEILEYLYDLKTMTVEESRPISFWEMGGGRGDPTPSAINYIVSKFSDLCILKGGVWVPMWRKRKNYNISNTGYIHRCLRDKTNRFIVAPLTLFSFRAPIGAHANIVIYDKSINTIEIFDPHGKRNKSYAKTEEDVYNEFTRILGISGIEPPILIRSIEICPNINYQTQTQTKNKKRGTITIKTENKTIPGGPQIKAEVLYTGKRYIGNCLLWSFIYLDLRLTFPDVNPQEMMDMVLSLSGEDLSDIAISFFHEIDEFRRGPYKVIVVDEGEDEEYQPKLKY
jgi:hypothetical protein